MFGWFVFLLLLHVLLSAVLLVQLKPLLKSLGFFLTKRNLQSALHFELSKLVTFYCFLFSFFRL